MKTLMLVNGLSGTGKTTISKALFASLNNGAWIDTDDLMHVRPWNPNDNLYGLALKNAIAAAQNLFESGYEVVVLTGCVHTPSFFSMICSSLKGVSIVYVSLIATEEDRASRQRERGDAEPCADSANECLRAEDVPPARFVELNTSNLSVEEVVRHILLLT